MYSVDCETSYRSIIQWQSDIERYCPPQTRVLIIGNKCDIANRLVPVEDGLMVSYWVLQLNMLSFDVSIF